MYESPQIRANSAPYIPLSLSLGILLPALATSTSLRAITSFMSSVKLDHDWLSLSFMES